MKRKTLLIFALACMFQVCAHAQIPDVNQIPSYTPQRKVEGAIRVFGSELKGQMVVWEAGFLKYQPDAVFANNFMTSSEGSMAGLYTGISDMAPAGDDAKITDRMPFYNTFHYLPTEVSVATGGYERRGTLWAIQIVVNKDNPLSKLTMEQLDGIFGSARTGGWDGIFYTSKYARGADKNIRTWGQLGLTGEWANKPIHTYGYAAPGFAVAFQRKIFHWSDKWNGNFKEYVESREVTPDADGQKVASERMFEDLSKDKYGIAWVPLLHSKDYPAVKGVALANTAAGPYVSMTEANVQNRSYPFIRDAYIYLNIAPGQPLNPNVAEFMRYILSRQGQQDIIGPGNYYPLPAAMVARERTKLK